MTAVTLKNKLLDSVASISATETDGTVFDLRGAEDVSFTVLATLNTGFSTGTNYFKCSILGCNTRDGTFVPLNGLETAELVVDVAQQIPSASNAPGVVLPRFIKVKWTETGTISAFTATCRMLFNRTKKGPSVAHGYMGG